MFNKHNTDTHTSFTVAQSCSFK